MNTNPTAKRVLCYGDSLTHGSDHQNQKSTRFPINIRWTGILQNELGMDYEIIEEGLSGRTTDLDDPKKPGRNGLTYYQSCISSHLPLNLIVLLLGLNDLKNRFQKTPHQIAQSLLSYFTATKNVYLDKELPIPTILLLSPPLIIQKNVPTDYDISDGNTKSKQLSSEYEIIAKDQKALYFDLATLDLPLSADGLHPNSEGHKIIGSKIAELINNLNL
jgi:lysophospholipase L1-like esterase